MGEQRGFAPLLTVDLASVTVELNLRESGARFPCKWSSVLEIYNRIIMEVSNDESKKKTFTSYINELWSECIKNSDKCVVTGIKPFKKKD